jgi:DNA-binding transcriptional ArsR family regulator
MVDHNASLDRVFTAVADPTRRAILAVLSQRPATVGEIARPYPVSLNAISKHIKVLERAGLVRREVVGRSHYCHFEARPLRQATAWLERYREFWEVRLASPMGRCCSSPTATGGRPRGTSRYATRRGES